MRMVEDNGWIDRAGMEQLMKALGEDGLDDYAWACLIALWGASDGEEEEGAHANMICWLPINKLATIEPMRSC